METGWRLHGYQQAGTALIERLPDPAHTDATVTALLELTATWTHTAPVERWNAADMDRLVVLVLGEVDAELGERAEAWLARHPITAPLTLPLIAPTGADPALQIALHTLATAYLGSLLPEATAEHQALADRAAALTAALC